MTAIIDYDTGNLRSVAEALRRRVPPIRALRSAATALCGVV